MTHHDVPTKEGYEFLLLQLYVKKLQTDESSLSISDVSLQLDNTIYRQSDCSFLGNHDMTAFLTTEIRIEENQGYILFEIPSFSNHNNGTLFVGEEAYPIEITSPTVDSSTNINRTL